jgi:hypothetical protein
MLGFSNVRKYRMGGARWVWVFHYLLEWNNHVPIL